MNSAYRLRIKTLTYYIQLSKDYSDAVVLNSLISDSFLPPMSTKIEHTV